MPFVSRDRLAPDSRAARRGRDTAPAPALDSVRNTTEARADQVVRAERIPDRAAHTDPNNAPAAPRSSDANHNHILRSAMSAGTPDAAGHQPSDILAAPPPTAEVEQQAAAEMLRLDIAARPDPAR